MRVEGVPIAEWGFSLLVIGLEWFSSQQQFSKGQIPSE
jgi:hypothetical protein